MRLHLRNYAPFGAALLGLSLAACGDDGTPTATTTREPAGLAATAAAPTSFELVDIWGDDESEPEFLGLNHMGFGPDGNLYLMEFFGGRLFKLSPEGEVLAQWAGSGSVAGQLGNPTGIHVGPDGSIYVGESGTSRVQKTCTRPLPSFSHRNCPTAC